MYDGRGHDGEHTIAYFANDIVSTMVLGIECLPLNTQHRFRSSHLFSFYFS